MRAATWWAPTFRSPVRPFARSPVRPFARSPVRPFARSPVRPFARSRAERGDDPRLSLEERYGTHTRYVARVREAAQLLQQEGFLLPQDAERIIREAEQRDLGLPR